MFVGPAFEWPAFEGPALEGPEFEGTGSNALTLDGPALEGSSLEGPAFKGIDWEGPVFNLYPELEGSESAGSILDVSLLLEITFIGMLVADINGTIFDLFLCLL